MSAETIILTREQVQQRTFIAQVYAWMTFALGITALVAWFVQATPELLTAILGNSWTFIGLLIAELLLVIFLTKAIDRLSGQVATFVFFAYAMLNGVTFAAIFLVYTMSSIAATFWITAATFGAMSFYGYITKRDLTSIGNFCGMALLGLIVATLVNLFFQNNMIYWITTYAGVLIFVGLTAYDTQKIKNIHSEALGGEEGERKVAILAALALYLDFINLFILLLRFFGRRR
ncbi:hypothetical protein EDC14_102525 [Hydrogenispora ethanolica]|jgi:FtsH-binding integral membrane protein|uniref:Modulator of FtsH protease n=1 Tax=Hydrogenispora ethanolica TaxID=1082276 RepID=A0A4R1R9P0_HYDET|nr:Bax inhibitor-1/YccA family protein [Hydrogenispora ethanolica]TCL62406.1 hypothetical protein EDC14_102525 [Hydrogenispora ethanolica]